MATVDWDQEDFMIADHDQYTKDLPLTRTSMKGLKATMFVCRPYPVLPLVVICIRPKSCLTVPPSLTRPLCFVRPK